MHIGHILQLQAPSDFSKENVDIEIQIQTYCIPCIDYNVMSMYGAEKLNSISKSCLHLYLQNE